MTKLWWIKERHNPQLGVYFVPEGQLSKRAAKAAERAIYGSNYMCSFNSEKAYLARIAELKAAGHRIIT